MHSVDVATKKLRADMHMLHSILVRHTPDKDKFHTSLRSLLIIHIGNMCTNTPTHQAEIHAFMYVCMYVCMYVYTSLIKLKCMSLCMDVCMQYYVCTQHIKLKCTPLCVHVCMCVHNTSSWNACLSCASSLTLSFHAPSETCNSNKKKHNAPSGNPVLSYASSLLHTPLSHKILSVQDKKQTNTFTQHTRLRSTPFLCVFVASTLHSSSIAVAFISVSTWNPALMAFSRYFSREATKLCEGSSAHGTGYVIFSGLSLITSYTPKRAPEKKRFVCACVCCL